MSDYTTTPNLGLYKPTYNADDGQWGGHLNANADTLDTLLGTGPAGRFLPLAGGTMQGSIDMGGHLITDSNAPINPLDLANKSYVDTLSIIATGSITSRALTDRFADIANVLDYGADPTGVADSAPAFRAVLGSNRRIVVPPGTYLFNSTTAALPPPYGNVMQQGVLVQGFSNFTIEGYGATIAMGNSVNRSNVFTFEGCHYFSVSGLTINGNRTGLTSSDPSCALMVMSSTGFVFEDIHLTPWWTNAIAGDWLVNGTFRNIICDRANFVFDIAYLKQVLIDNCRGIGTNGTGGTGAANAGGTGFSCIIDPPNAGANNSGVAFTETTNVTVRGCDFQNFGTGIYFQTGTYLTIEGNFLHDNPGVTAGPTPGVGINISGYTSGVQSSCYAIIANNQIAHNGANVAGYGIFVGSSGISDTITSLTIRNNTIDNNTATGIECATTTNLVSVSEFGNTFTGGAQTTPIGPNFATVATTFVRSPIQFNANLAMNSTATVSTGPLAVANGLQLHMLDTGGSPALLRVQSDNNLVLAGTGSGGASRNLMTAAMRSDTSALTFPVAAQFNGAVTVAGLETNTSGRILSKAATNSSVAVSDGTTAIGMFISGGGLDFGPCNNTTAAPTAVWASFDTSGNYSPHLVAAASDAAAATAGCPVGGLYNNAGVVHVRLA